MIGWPLLRLPHPGLLAPVLLLLAAPAYAQLLPGRLEPSGELTYFIADGPAETGVPNVVTAVLASYRGYDTLGEVTVIFTAGVGVLALLGLRGRTRDD